MEHKFAGHPVYSKALAALAQEIASPPTIENNNRTYVSVANVVRRKAIDKVVHGWTEFTQVSDDMTIRENIPDLVTVAKGSEYAYDKITPILQILNNKQMLTEKQAAILVTKPEFNNIVRITALVNS